MNKELDNKLCQTYPKIFVQRKWTMDKTCMCWGFEIADSWYPLIDRLCKWLQWYCDKHPEVTQVVATQVKEKFGGLRFYVEGGDDRTMDIIWFAESIANLIPEKADVPA